jgi:hypothetical protein
MTFLQLQNELISVPAARFKETQRTSVTYWLNAALGEFWNADEWSFRNGTGNATVTAGSSALTGLPADFGTALGLYRADGVSVNYLRPRKFLEAYQASTLTGLPTDYTLIGSSGLVGPVSSETATYQLLYEKALTQLSADADVPAIPAEYHYALVYGASVKGLVQEQDFTFQFAAGEWQKAIDSCRQNYLDDQRGQTTQWPSWSTAGNDW